MTKEEFDREADELPVNLLNIYLNHIREGRKNLLQAAATQTSVNTHLADYHLVQATLQMSAIAIGVLDENCPGFKERIATYRQLQTQLAQDLEKLRNVSNKGLGMFRNYL